MWWALPTLPLQGQLYCLAGFGRSVGGENQLVSFDRIVNIRQHRLAIENSGYESLDLAIEWMMGNIAAVGKDGGDGAPAGLAWE
jgi:hypothetical protein